MIEIGANLAKLIIEIVCVLGGVTIALAFFYLMSKE